MSPRFSLQTLAELKAAFDESFANPPPGERDAHEDFLLIRAKNQRLCVRVRETAAVLRCPPVTALPSSDPALCGLSGVRGALVAVYSIAALAGETRSPDNRGWILLCAGDRSIALFFDQLLSYARTPSTNVYVNESAGGLGNHVVEIDGSKQSVLDIPQLLQTLHRARRSGINEE